MLSPAPRSATQYVSAFETPLGGMLAVVDGAGALLRLEFAADPIMHKHKVAQQAEWDELRCSAVRTQLSEYFAGQRRGFDLPVAPQGTVFQRRVWTALMDIPYGSTASYGDLARLLNQPIESSRAVGSANGANPVAVVIPCHRVVGSNGALTGYAYGLEHKRRLLELEGALTPQLF